MCMTAAYHEAGHAVVAAWLGAEVLSVTLEPEQDDGAVRDGDAAVRWHHRGISQRELCRRELMAVLAGPVAEMIYSGQRCGVQSLPQWAADWQLACSLAEMLTGSEVRARALIQVVTDQLDRLARCDPFWQAIAEVADLLEAFETIDGEQVQECLERWLRS